MSTLPKSEFQMLPLSRLHESSTNPRRVFDDAKLLELAASLKAQGLIQPIVARPNADGFEIVAGARRYRAAQLAELSEIPTRVVPLTDEQALEWQLIELSTVVKRFLSCFVLLHVVDISTTCIFRAHKGNYIQRARSHAGRNSRQRSEAGLLPSVIAIPEN